MRFVKRIRNDLVGTITLFFNTLNGYGAKGQEKNFKKFLTSFFWPLMVFFAAMEAILLFFVSLITGGTAQKETPKAALLFIRTPLVVTLVAWVLSFAMPELYKNLHEFSPFGISQASVSLNTFYSSIAASIENLTDNVPDYDFMAIPVRLAYMLMYLLVNAFFWGVATVPIFAMAFWILFIVNIVVLFFDLLTNGKESYICTFIIENIINPIYALIGMSIEGIQVWLNLIPVLNIFSYRLFNKLGRNSYLFRIPVYNKWLSDDV